MGIFILPLHTLFKVEYLHPVFKLELADF